MAAKNEGFSFFSIQYYGQCWSGENAGETYKRNGVSSKCINKESKACSNDDLSECGGQEETNFVYGLDTPQSKTNNKTYVSNSYSQSANHQTNDTARNSTNHSSNHRNKYISMLLTVDLTVDLTR
ncbi:hypothetical protein QZH41_008962 [Actinostola sp. cb2023]|nr:hypothetical protein QZH41_008962 [Actinostola sp. cb2023]